MNAQRKAIYKKRKNALFGDRLDIDVDNMFYELCEETVLKLANSEFNEFEIELIRLIGIESPVNEEEFKSLDKMELIHAVYIAMMQQYKRKSEKICITAMPQIKHVHETMSDRFKNIVFPLTDGKKELQLIVNLEDAYKSNGAIISKYFEKNIILGIIDNEWKEHLREMDDLRSAVNNATYEQKDPLVIYKLESYELFKNMLYRLNQEAVELLMKLDIPAEKELQSTNKEDTQNNYGNSKMNNSNATAPPQFRGSDGYRQAVQNSMSAPEKKQPTIAETKVNRNDPCPCGSGKKYKQCHGK